MKKEFGSVSAVFLALSLVACGGGGSADTNGQIAGTGAIAGSGSTGTGTGATTTTGTAATTSPATVAFEVAPPARSVTGLSFTSLRALGNDSTTLAQVASNLKVAFAAGPAVMAVQSMGKVTKPYGTVDCTSGSAASNGFLTRCAVDGYALTAITASSGAVGGAYQITTSGLNVESPQYFGAAAMPLGQVTADCDTVSGVSKCRATYKGTDDIDYLFGWDATLSLVEGVLKLSGTHGCGCDTTVGTWLITYQDFSALGGRALVVGQGSQKAEFVRRDVDVFDIIWDDGTQTRRYRLTGSTLVESI